MNRTEHRFIHNMARSEGPFPDETIDANLRCATMSDATRLLDAVQHGDRKLRMNFAGNWYPMASKSLSKTAGRDQAIMISRYRMYRGNEIVLGPGKADLLEHIQETGSISEAARIMRMSYNRAWLHVKVMNEGFKEALVHASRGGHEHGGASLTRMGRLVLRLYRQIEARAARATKASSAALGKLLKT